MPSTKLKQPQKFAIFILKSPSLLLKTESHLMKLEWKYSDHESDWEIDWNELSNLYKIAPLGEKHPQDLQIAFGNSQYKCFVLYGKFIVAAGRALADGTDCSYLCDIAVDPGFQGTGLGKAVVQTLVDFSAGHKKIILYAEPGKELFYKKLGFSLMNTAMAIFEDRDAAIQMGLIRHS